MVQLTDNILYNRQEMQAVTSAHKDKPFPWMNLTLTLTNPYYKSYPNSNSNYPLP